MEIPFSFSERGKRQGKKEENMERGKRERKKKGRGAMSRKQPEVNPIRTSEVRLGRARK